MSTIHSSPSRLKRRASQTSSSRKQSPTTPFPPSTPSPLKSDEHRDVERREVESEGYILEAKDPQLTLLPQVSRACGLQLRRVGRLPMGVPPVQDVNVRAHVFRSCLLRLLGTAGETSSR